MKVFVTGATGFIGTAVVRELLQAGHQVLGLARNDAGTEKLQRAGAQVHRGGLEDLASLKAGAAAADGVIHLAFVHTFPGVILAARKDKKAIDAIGSTLEGSGKPLLVAGAVIGLRPGVLLTEDYVPNYGKVPRKSEEAVLSWASKGVRAAVVRLPPTVHGEGDKGFMSSFVASAGKNKASFFVKDGAQRWAAVHRVDAAKVFRLALEKGKSGAIHHAIGDQGVPFSDIATAIGKGVGVPAASKSRFGAMWSLGFLGMLAGIDGPASSQQTQDTLGWVPNQPTLLEDLSSGVYFGGSNVPLLRG